MSLTVFSAACLFLFAAFIWIISEMMLLLPQVLPAHTLSHSAVLSFLSGLFLWALFFALVFPEMAAVLDFYKSRWHVFNHNFCLLFDSLFSGDFSSLAIGFILTVFFLFLVSCLDFVLFIFDQYSFSSEGCSSWIISVPGDW